MTRSIGIVERIRWISALGASGLLALVLTVGLHQLQPPTLTAAAAPSVTAPAGSSAVLDPRIASLAARHPGQLVQAIVQFKAGVGVDRARWDVSRFQGHVFGQLHIINALAVKLTAANARRLAGSTDVHAISLNTQVKTEGGPQLDGPHHGRDLISTRDLQTTYNQTLATTGLWQVGFDGAGVGVAVIDTGIDGDLPDFRGANGNSRVVETAVTNPNATNATDGYGHGTDVAGIIAGNGNNLNPSNPLKGDYVGVAPGANLISIKASDQNGKATVLNVIYGLQFAVDHKSDYNLRVVNLSLDSKTPQSYKTDPLDAAVESAWMHGIVVVAAAGNRGTDSGAVQYAPANDPYAITVGAVDEQDQSNPANDVITSWSSRGTTQDGFQKPDVYAPGAHIVSVLAPNSAFAGMCSACTVGGAYIRTSGTSMATPMISGLVADLLQIHPYWSPDQVKGALTSPGVASNSYFQEVSASKLAMLWNPPLADQGLTPNSLISDAQGDINYSQSSWSQSSWSQASGGLNAGFAQSSWSCTCLASDSSVDPSQSSWNTSSWSTSSWSTYFDQTSDAG